LDLEIITFLGIPKRFK